jgi:hypothetical protein
VDERVVQINLSNYVNGTFPPNIGKLTELMAFSNYGSTGPNGTTGGMEMAGEIPDNIRNCTKLLVLSIIIIFSQ